MSKAKQDALRAFYEGIKKMSELVSEEDLKNE
jgi:hypothetical protein